MDLASQKSGLAAQAHTNSGEGVCAAPSNEYLMWNPCPTKDHHLEKLRMQINAEHGIELANYNQLHKWSCDNYDLFWGLVWDYCQVVHSKKADQVIDKSVNIQKVPKWFTGARLNYAENLLRYPNKDKVALYYTTERKDVIGVGQKTFGQLQQNVAHMAASLKALGVKKGDRVVGYMPNCPEAIEAMAATASLGAVWSSTSPDFGVGGVLDRFKQICPKVVFSVEAVSYNMKTHDHLGKLRQVVAGLGLEQVSCVVVVPFVKDKSEVQLDKTNKETWLDEFLDLSQQDVNRNELTFEQVPFDHPLFIMYSSGTTGKPKCMVHGVGGTLMKHLEEHQIQGNRTDNDVLLYYTTTGWMMWNWMVTALALGTSLVLYDGSPLHPHPASLWDLVDDCGITVFGTSAKWIAVQEDRGVKPRLTHKLTTLKAICSTGSPLKPHSYDYVYKDIKPNVLLASISGGTDIIACFMGENSTLPVHKGEVQSAHLGCALECWDADAARSVDPGTSGELVCTKPFISMPVCFWNDPDFKLYRAAYFDKIPLVWAHGDYFMVNPKTGGMLMLGRSDGTLNPNGVRFGSAEIYNVVEPFEQIADSLCVGQRSPIDGEERVLLFLKMAEGQKYSEDLVKEIRAKIRAALSARHVPAIILPITDIPYTVNGKKVEVAVKKILSDLPVKNQGALANPQCLNLYKDIPEVQQW